MTTNQLLDLMQEAGFNTDWVSHPHAREIFDKYACFADLIEEKVRHDLLPNQLPVKDSSIYLKQ